MSPATSSAAPSAIPPEQVALPRELSSFIDGAYVTASRREFDDVDPTTGRAAAVAYEATRDDVDAAVSAARAALHGPWGRFSIEQRCALLLKVADRIQQRFSEFLAAEIRDTGKPVALASHIDIPRGAANFRVFAELLKAHPTEAFAMDTPDGNGALNYAVRRPRGVIGVICPWNLPLLLMTWKVAPALACGNTVVVKPSEETPATATLLGHVMNEVGIPTGVYNVVLGFGADSAGQFLTEHPGVDGITFTGETATGEIIMRAAAHGARPVSMELGGKNPGLVFADCDLDKAVEGTLRSSFANCGQVCLSTERLYVERSIFEPFAERLVRGARALRFGDPYANATTTGPLISAAHRAKVLGYYAKARAEGAEVRCGGGVPEVSAAYQDGFWIEPTVWTGLPDAATVCREEIFGPCVHVAPFDEEEEAIARANDSPYGLAATLWTQNLTRAHRISRRLDAGLVWVNSWFLRDLRTAFGGAKRSGIGREGGSHAFEFYTETSNICIKC